MNKRTNFFIHLSLVFLFAVAGAFFCFAQDFDSTKKTTYEKESDSIVEVVLTKEKSFFDCEEELSAFAQENEYLYFEEDGVLNFYNKFNLKTLMVIGESDFSAYKNVEKSDEFSTTLTFESEEETKVAFEELSKNPNIQVFVDQIVTSSDSYSLDDDPIGWGYDTINVGPYWQYLEDNSVDEEVVVVVIDSGINTSHIKLKDRILKDEFGNYVGYAYVDTTAVSSYNFEDDRGHGTHVAGIICDTTPANVKILPMKMLDYSGSMSVTLRQYVQPFIDVATYAQKYNIVAVNMSYGGESDSSGISFVESYLSYYLTNNDILPIAAAGNESVEINNNYLPASCPSAITVSALRQTIDFCEFEDRYSNYGPDVDISAPGTNVNSADIGSSTATDYKSGTSMATPYVSAVVALLYLDPIYAGNPTASTIEERLYKLTIDLGDPNRDDLYGYGALSLNCFNGSINYEASDMTVTYDGEFHTISVTVKDEGEPTILYGFSIGNISIADISTDIRFKNWTDGKLPVYFKISMAGESDVVGMRYLQIDKCEISVGITQQTSIYGENHTLSQTAYTLSQAPYGSDDLGILLECDIDRFSPAGLHTITAYYTNSNYHLQLSSNGGYLINPRPIKLKLKNQTVTYGYSFSLNCTYDILEGEIKNGDNLSITATTTANANSPASTYPIKFVSGNANYDIDCGDGTLTISPREIEISIVQSGLYGNEAKLDKNDYDIVTGELKSGDVLFTSLSTTATIISPIGDYPISVSGKNANYDITTSTLKYVVSPRPLTLSVGDATSEYGESVSLDQNNYSLTNLANNDDLNVVLSTTATDGAEANDYEITATYSADNYIVTLEKGTYTISKRSILIESVQEFVYGSEIDLDDNDFQDKNSRLLTGDSLNLKLSSTTTKGSPVGDYEFIVDSCNKNYEVTFTEASKVTILPKSITIAISDKTLEYGEKLDENEIVLDLSEVESGDDLNLSLTGNFKTAKNVGEYTISLSFDNDNYLVSVENGKLIIGQRAISVLVEKEVTYGEDIDLVNVEFVDPDERMVFGDNLNLNLSTTAVKFSSQGKYDVAYVSSNANYNVTLLPASYLKINPRPITISVGDASSIYGENISLASVTVDKSQVLNGDNLNIEVTTTATKTSNHGTYPITISFSNDNYVVTVDEGTYTIEKKEVRVKIGDQRVTYGEPIVFDEHEYTIETEGVSATDLKVVLACGISLNADAGKYDIEIYSYNKNYTLKDYMVGSFYVDAKEISVKVVQEMTYGDSFVYDGTYSDVNSEVITGDNLDLGLSTIATNKSVVGDYDLCVSSSNANYIVSLTGDSCLKIKPKTIKVSLGDLTKVYLDDIDLSKIVVDKSQVFAGDDLDENIVSTATKSSPVGEYEISLTSGNQNYIVEVEKGKYVVTKRNVFVSVSDANMVYGDKIDFDKLGYECNDPKVTKQDLSVVFDLEKDKFYSVGDYAINVADFDKENFKLSFASGNLTISPRKLKVSLKNQTQGHLTFASPDQNAYEVVEGEVVEGDNLNIVISVKDGFVLGFGEYDLAAYCNNKNYEVEFELAKVNIEFSAVDIAIVGVVAISIVVAIIFIVKKVRTKRKVKDEYTF